MATFDEFYAAMNPDAGIRGNEFEQKFLPELNNPWSASASKSRRKGG